MAPLVRVIVWPERFAAKVMTLPSVAVMTAWRREPGPELAVGGYLHDLQFRRADVHIRARQPRQPALVGRRKLVTESLPASIAGEPGSGGVVSVGPP